MNIEPVQRVLDSLNVRYALIGAHALAARGYPRFTVDIDLLTAAARVLERAPWASLEREGAHVDPRRGDDDDPLGGVVHIVLPDLTDIDVMVAKSQWEADIIDRADMMRVAEHVTIRVPQASDLILLKLAAGGYLDLHDAAALLAIGDRDALVREVETRIGEVRPDVRAVWEDLLRATP